MKTHYTLAECAGIFRKGRNRMDDPSNEIVGIFGYGSLVAKHEMKKRKIPGRPEPCYANLNGYQRNWKACSSHSFSGIQVGICYCGIEKMPGTRMNGVVFFVDGWDLAQLDMREMLYERIDVSGAVTNWNTGVVIPGKIYAYLPDKNAVKDFNFHANRSTAFIEKIYYDLVNKAFADGGRDFISEFNRSTIIHPGIRVI